LCDYETPLHLSASVAARSGIADYLRFHSDAVLVADPGAASFALVDLAHDRLSLAGYHQGTPEYPDRSTTIIALSPSLTDGPRLRFAGPGIARTADVAIAGLPDDFTDQWLANRARFPLGVDLIFAAHGQVVGLPRSARLIEEAR
ncbi:MAG: phosphonate C-P lyase system protein PhnH, partial [Beijerinckiaceae bacterium]